MNQPGQDQSNFQSGNSLFPQDRPDIAPQGLTEPDKGVQAPIMSVNDAIDQEVAGMVMSRMELSKTWRRTRRLVWDKCWQHMKGIYDTANKAAWQSKTFMPLTSKVVEIIAANLRIHHEKKFSKY